MFKNWHKAEFFQSKTQHPKCKTIIKVPIFKGWEIQIDIISFFFFTPFKRHWGRPRRLLWAKTQLLKGRRPRRRGLGVADGGPPAGQQLAGRVRGAAVHGGRGPCLRGGWLLLVMYFGSVQCIGCRMPRYLVNDKVNAPFLFNCSLFLLFCP